MKTIEFLQGWRKQFLTRGLIFVAIAFAALFASTLDQPASALTTVPTKMNFQGRITNSAGNILANGTYNMKFRIYDAASSGTLQWNEDRLVSATQGVTVANGMFSVQLGSVSSLPASIFTSNSLYFEVELPTPASATTSSPVWTEGAMTPRNQLATSAYAYNAETLDGIDSASFAQLGSSSTYTGSNTFSGANSFTGATNVNLANANAFQVKSGSTNLFNVDSTNSILSIGTSDTTGAVLVLDTKSGAGDPTGGSATNGAMYYNSNSGKFRCYQSGAWTDCIAAGGSTTLQNAYDNSTTPATITTSSATKGVKVAAGAAPTTDIFTIDNAGQAVTTAGVSGLEVNYVGGTGAIEASGVRVDLTPGGTTGATWNGMRIVANATGAASGVSENGLKIDGPTSPGTGTETALYVGTGWDIGLDLNSGGIQLTSMTSDPSTPVAGDLKVYARTVAGRPLLSGKGPTGVNFAYQPSLFQQNVQMITPGNAATANSVTALGGTTTSTGTNSMAATSEAQGVMGNWATAATAASTAGTGSATTQFYRGSVANGANGFFYMARINLPDALAKYNNTTTGSRLFMGFSDQTMAAMVGSDNPTGNYAGFTYSGVRDTGGAWQFMTKNGTTQSVVSTGVTLAVAKTYDMYIYTPPQGGTIYWRLDNLTDGVAPVENSTTTNMPTATTAMRAGIQIATLEAVAHNLRWQRIYAESDR